MLHCRSQGDGARAARIVCPATHRMANARWVSRAGSGSSALLRCPASASALERASRLADRCAKTASSYALCSGSGSSALLRCPASASALERALRLADRCAKNPSLFPPQAAVGILALDRTHCDALGEVLLEDEEDDDDRHCGQCGTGHDQAEVGAVLCLQFRNAQRNGQVAGAGQHD